MEDKTRSKSFNGYPETRTLSGTTLHRGETRPILNKRKTILEGNHDKTVVRFQLDGVDKHTSRARSYSYHDPSRDSSTSFHSTSMAPQVQKAIWNGKRTMIQGNSAKTIVRFELEEGHKRTVVIAEDLSWRRRRDENGNELGHYSIITHYVMDTREEPKRWVNLDGTTNIDP